MNTQINTKWSLKQCKRNAKKYKTRWEWQQKDKNYYQTALRLGWLNECCAHMELKRDYFTLKVCKNIALKYNSKAEWKRNQSHSYIVAEKNNWLEHCCKHMQSKFNTQRMIKNLDTGRIFKSLTEASLFYKISVSSICIAARNEDKTAGGYRWTYFDNVPRTKEYKTTDVRNIAGFYNHKALFMKQENSVYQKSLKLNMTNELCKNMIRNTKWTLESCKSIALQYTLRKDWFQGHPNSYVAAFRNGWGEECCSHMPKSLNAKPVKNLVSGEVFESTAKAAESVNLKNASNIAKAIRNNTICAGCNWAYCDNEGNVL